MWLERDLIYSPSVQPVRLPNQNEVIVHGAIAYTSGWGRTSKRYNSKSSRKLKWIALEIVSNKRCNIKLKGEVLNNMLCAFSKTCEQDSMQGDSGGALVIGDVQIGVVSWGREYSQRRKKHKYPGVYTRVASFIDWIKSVV